MADVRHRQPLRLAILDAERILSAAGIDSARFDAEEIAAHVVGVERMKLPLVQAQRTASTRNVIRRLAASTMCSIRAVSRSASTS